MCWGKGGRRGGRSSNRFGRGRVQGCPALHSAGCCRRRGRWRALGSVEQLQELTLKPAEPLVSALLLTENHSPTFPMEQAQTSTRCRVNWDTEQQLHTLLFPCREGEGSGVLGWGLCRHSPTCHGAVECLLEEYLLLWATEAMGSSLFIFPEQSMMCSAPSGGVWDGGKGHSR